MKNISALLLILFFCSCHQSKDKAGNNNSALIDTVDAIDYKAASYHLFLGQTKDSIEKSIQLQHDYLADDGIINDSGTTRYMTTNEPVIMMDSSSLLPALFFTTNKKILTEFKCAILFTPKKKDSASFMHFLTTISPLFKNLRSDSNRKKFASTMNLQIGDGGSADQYKLDTAGRKYDVLFTYIKGIIIF